MQGFQRMLIGVREHTAFKYWTQIVLLAITPCVLAQTQDSGLVEQNAVQLKDTLEQTPTLALDRAAVTIKIPPSWTVGKIAGVGIDKKSVAYVFQRAPQT